MVFDLKLGNALPDFINELASGGQLADVEVEELERQVSADVSEDVRRGNRKVGLFVISALFLAIFPEILACPSSSEGRWPQSFFLYLWRGNAGRTLPCCNIPYLIDICALW